MIKEVDFKTYKRKCDIHGTVLYPAVMVAPFQKQVLEEIIKHLSIKSVFDPFHGSGTTLYECSKIDSKIKLFGCDINPLANLITKVKLQGIDSNFLTDFTNLKYFLENNKIVVTHNFNNIDKWFNKDIIISLSLLRMGIKKIDNFKNRLFFWYILIDIIRKYSNSRSSTYKLHIKKNKAIENNVIRDYITNVDNAWRYFDCKGTNKFNLYKEDILNAMNKFNDDAFDVTITSPPYGDNATTVPYGQFSMLPLFWIDKKDLEIEGWEYDNYSIIDSKSIGGNRSVYNDISCEDFKLIKDYVLKINEKKRRKVLYFFGGYFQSLKHICRVTKKYIIITLGNRTVDNVKIDLNDISTNFIELNGFKIKAVYKREIPYKIIPKILANKMESINIEYTCIFEKVDYKY